MASAYIEIPSIEVPVEHQPVIHEIDMRANIEPPSITLLELVDAVSEVAENEQEVVATVTYMLNSGRIKLAGNFRDVPAAKLCS